MGKGSKRQRQKKDTENPKRRKRDENFSEQDMDDEIDAFHKQRDIVPLDVDGDVGSSEEDEEHAVLDLENEDDFDDDDEEEEARHDTGLAAKIVRQQKLLRQKHGGVEDEMHDDDAEDEEKKGTWGTRKHTYYNSENVDEMQSSDDDLAAEEEEEAIRMQREKAQSYHDQDFEVGDQDLGGSDREKTLFDVLPKIRPKPHEDKNIEDDTGIAFEEVIKDLNALSKEEQMEVVYSSAPELVGLLSELNDALDQLESKVNPLLSKVKERNGIAKEGIRYLEVKQLLLLSYCQAISFYLLLKSEGHPVRDHPVLTRVVEIKCMLDKMKQIDASLPLEIGEILNQYQESESGIEPIKEVMLSSKPDSMDSEPSSVPNVTINTSLPKETAGLLKDSSSKDHENKQEKRKRLNDHIGVQSMEMLRLRASLEENLKQKGTFSSQENKPDKTRKHLMHTANRQFETLDDFADEVIDKEGGTDGHANSLLSSKLSQLVRTKLNKPKVISGDDDLPKRDDIGERQRKSELRVLAHAGVKSTDEITEEVEDFKGIEVVPVDTIVEENTETAELEDDFYKEVKRKRAAKLSSKAVTSTRKQLVPSSAEAEIVVGKRHITYQMEKNRGLTRSRKKLNKNPRKKYRLKHDKAKTNRKGQVRDVKRPSGPYGGEVSGINAGISRSVRFKN